LVGVRGVNLRAARWEPFTQPAKRLVDLPERELVYAEGINEHLEDDPLRLRE
jgi:hypothetical protein